jgi:hypothetical protein
VRRGTRNWKDWHGVLHSPLRTTYNLIKLSEAPSGALYLYPSSLFTALNSTLQEDLRI